ncbi:oligosaccharide flippase family protein [Flavobacterium sp. 245]|uniref:oligosaccharide flippase family protein n=1 Tax=Flavobacterium sp. 245 TaxID=2512115 RepID=UPI00105B9062|nr:oligosaccharide flippase family protein [Flavobacterium sp. 245]TDP02433.1 PST family polysaccharide transporter [Flavobacterium sp. 245]
MILKNVNIKSPLISNFLSLVILQGANYIFPLLTIPYLFRTLGVETFGLISFATAFAQYFVILTDFGFGIYGVQYVSANRDNKELRDVFFVNVVIAQLFLFVLGLLFLLSIIFISDKFYVDRWVYLISFMSVFGTVLLPAWFFQGIEQMKYITRINIVTRTLSIIPIFFFVKSDADYLLVPFFYGLGSITSGAIALYVASKRFKVDLNFFRASFSGIRLCLTESSTFFVSRISVSLYTVSNSFVLGLVLGNVAVGYYAAAEKLYSAIQSVYSPLSSAIYPHMVKSKDLSMFKKIFGFAILINCLSIPICIYYADFIMSLIYKNLAKESIAIFRILLVECLLSIPSILIGYPLLGAFGHAKYANFTVIVSSFFHIVGLAILFFTNNITVITVACLVVLTQVVVLSLRSVGVYTKILK